jgi:hypothetical protein
MESSFRNLIPFVALILRLSIPKTRLHSIPPLPSSYPARLASRNSTLISRFNYSLFSATIITLYCRTFLIMKLQGSRRKQSMYCWGGVFTSSLPSNRRRIVARFGSRGNVFKESLPSNGYIHTRHNKLPIINITRVLREVTSVYLRQQMWDCGKARACESHDSLPSKPSHNWSQTVCSCFYRVGYDVSSDW